MDENKNLLWQRSLYIVVIISLVFITASSVYFMVFLPIQENAPYKKCIELSEDVYNMKIEAQQKSRDLGKITDQAKNLAIAVAEIEKTKEQEDCFIKYKK